MKGDPFYYHKNTKEQQERLEATREQYRRIRDGLMSLELENGPQTHQRLLAIDRLQESMHHAICAMSISEDAAEVKGK